MALTLTPGLGTEDAQTLATANEALQVSWGSKPPRILTIYLDGATGGYAFTGTDGAALGTDRVDIPASTSYVLDLRNGPSRNLDVTSIYIEADTNGTDLQLTREY